jgi:hypothetical protein
LSLGGHVTLAALSAGAIELDGLVALSANTWLKHTEPSTRRRLLKSIGMRAMLGLTRAIGHYPARRLRVGPCDESLPYVEDLCGYWFKDQWRSRAGVDWEAGLPAVTARVLSVTGRADRLLAHPESVACFFARVPGVTTVSVGRGDCGLAWNPDHMGLGADPRSRGVWRWVGRWMRAAR